MYLTSKSKILSRIYISRKRGINLFIKKFNVKNIFKKADTSKGGIKMGLFVHTTKFQFIRLMYSPICRLYRVIQDFVQKAIFSEIQAITSGCDNYV